MGGWEGAAKYALQRYLSGWTYALKVQERSLGGEGTAKSERRVGWAEGKPFTMPHWQALEPRSPPTW